MRRLFSNAPGGAGRGSRSRSRKQGLRLERLEERALLSAGYVQTNLIADQPGIAAHTDRNLVNPWGISLSPVDGFWFSDNGSGKSTVDDASGAPSPASSPLIVSIPSATRGAPGSPTGTVFNGTGGFTISEGGISGSAFFLFATEDGTISGWNPTVDLSHAVLNVNHAASGAVYKGLAIGTDASTPYLYAADFGTGKIDVIDSNFQQVSLTGSFTDPNLPAGYAPFNVANLGGNLYVSYALQDGAKHDDVAGAGNGFVDEFSTSGVLIRRVASQGPLDSPWGMALAPASFGAFANDLLVGNFGDGRISAFDPSNGRFLGQLTDQNGRPVEIPGLWGLTFGGGGPGGDPGTLYFAAGPGDETHGLFGSLAPTSAPGSSPPGSTPTSPYGNPTPTSGLTAQGTSLAGRAGQAHSQIVAAFAESNTRPRGFRVSVNWGDSTRPSTARVKAAGPGQFVAVGAHRFRSPGTYTVMVSIADQAGHDTTVDSTAVITASARRGRHR